jgi:ABC-type transport system substrate-binding protein
MPYFDAVDDLVTQYRVGEYDPAAAEEIFTSLGYAKNSDGMWASSDGTVLSVTYVVNSNSTEEMNVSAVLADQLKNGGIDVDVQPLQDPTLASTDTGRGLHHQAAFVLSRLHLR